MPHQVQQLEQPPIPTMKLFKNYKGSRNLKLYFNICLCVCIFLTLFRQDIKSQVGIESLVQNPGFSLTVGYPRDASVWLLVSSGDC